MRTRLSWDGILSVNASTWQIDFIDNNVTVFLRRFPDSKRCPNHCGIQKWLCAKPLPRNALTGGAQAPHLHRTSSTSLPKPSLLPAASSRHVKFLLPPLCPHSPPGGSRECGFRSWNGAFFYNELSDDAADGGLSFPSEPDISSYNDDEVY